MRNDYQDLKNAQIYTDFLDSANGIIQQKILAESIIKALPASPEALILDAACGNGWLAAQIKPSRPKTYACDSSGTLIAIGKTRFPAVEFSHADLLKELPYPPGFFDAIILNMAAPDISDLIPALKNLAIKLKPGGQLLITVPNPYYTYPAAVWKRTLNDIFLFRKPRLIIDKEYFGPTQITREFNGHKIASNFYSLNDYFSAAASAGLTLHRFTELKSQTDSAEFDLNYQMFRYPLILLMEFKKA